MFGREELTFAEFGEKWIRDHAELKKLSTRDDYRGVVVHHLIPYFGRNKLADITPADCQAYVTSKREAGVHPRTINKTIMVLKLMFRHAEQWGYIKDNPARYIERPKVPHREMDYLEPSEIQSLLSACQPGFYLSWQPPY